MSLVELISTTKPNYWKSKTLCETSFKINTVPVVSKIDHQEPTFTNLGYNFVGNFIVVLLLINAKRIVASSPYSLVYSLPSFAH